MITETFSQFVVDTRTSDIPEAAMAEAKETLVDTIGVSLAGINEPVSKMARDWAAYCGSNGISRIIGSDLRTDPATAAFANGSAAHALDFDDSHRNMQGHVSAVSIPSAFALVEPCDTSGQELLAAVTIGVEIAARAGQLLGPGHYRRGFHKTATAGIFAAVTVAGRLLRLNVEQMRMAFGLAASQVGGLQANFGTMTKPAHAGLAARNGVFAALMVSRGFTSGSNVFDGAKSVQQVYGGDGISEESATAELGQEWQILSPGVSVKQWPCCFATHRPITGLVEIMKEHGLTASDIERVDFGFASGGDAALVYTSPKTGLEGKFSIEYVAAAMICDGSLKIPTFTDEMVQRPQVREMMAKMHRFTIPTEEYLPPSRAKIGVVVASRGKTFETTVDLVPGSRENPLTTDQIDEKFLSCAEVLLPEGQSRELLGVLRKVETLPNLNQIFELCACEPQSARLRA